MIGRMYSTYIKFGNKPILLQTNSKKILKYSIKFCNIVCSPHIFIRNCDRRIVILVSKKKNIKNMKFVYTDCGKIYYELNRSRKTLTVLLKQIGKGYIVSLIKVLVMILIACLEKLYVVHAALVMLDDKKFLIPGPSQTGKSTTALMLSKIGATILCDDHAILSKKQLLSCDYVVFLYNPNNSFSSIYEYELLAHSFKANLFFLPPQQLNKIILHILKVKKIIRLRKEGINKTYNILKEIL